MSAAIEIADVIELLADGDGQLQKLRASAQAHYDVVHKDHLVSPTHLVAV